MSSFVIQAYLLSNISVKIVVFIHEMTMFKLSSTPSPFNMGLTYKLLFFN